MLPYPVIDLHTHLRNDIAKHTKIAKESGIDIVLYMPNSFPPLDNLQRIKNSLKKKQYCKAIPVSAITKNLEGRELVDVETIQPYVAGFSDDGKCVHDLKLMKDILQMDVSVMLHCEPETKMLEKYLSVLDKVGGKLHIQHISKKESVELIRDAKQTLEFTCETCPHYFTYTKDDLNIKVNPPLGTEKDVEAIKEALCEDIIDVIASDYAPKPRKTGLAGFRSFLPLCYGLILDGTISKNQLKEKLLLNPKKIIESNGYSLEKFMKMFLYSNRLKKDDKRKIRE